MLNWLSFTDYTSKSHLHVKKALRMSENRQIAA
jgi:hypothetical protein